MKNCQQKNNLKRKQSWKLAGVHCYNKLVIFLLLYQWFYEIYKTHAIFEYSLYGKDISPQTMTTCSNKEKNKSKFNNCHFNCQKSEYKCIYSSQ